MNRITDQILQSSVSIATYSRIRGPETKNLCRRMHIHVQDGYICTCMCACICTCVSTRLSLGKESTRARFSNRQARETRENNIFFATLLLRMG